MMSTSSSTKLIILTHPMHLYIFIFFFFFMLIPMISCQSPTRYTPLDDIALGCGFPGRSQAQDRRYWDGDIRNSNLSLIEKLNTKSIPISAQKPPTKTIPYSTARISRSEFTYVFTVSSSGPKFIRLHFYPSSYQDFEPSKAFFSVKANEVTLLSNFSAFLTAASLGDQIVEKEFCINAGEEQRVINITFTPSATPSDAYAFINGIEIVSMPFDLYYGSDQPQGFTFIGNQNLYQFENNTALEMVHRLNVGGKFISPERDTGMYRTWKDDVGYFNIIGALPENTSIKLSFTKIPNYTAPDEVYQTARSMGNDNATNEGYNLTWSLPVDSGFTYMVRLHFCEFQPEIMKPGDREFRIYMANQTAEASADVIVWSDGNGVPFYKDYAVIVNDQGRGKKQNLSLALHPASAARTKYSDAILNGIEVFKLSDPTANLAGPNPDPPPSPPSTPSSPQPAKPKSKNIAAICGGVLAGVIALSVLGLLIFRGGWRVKDSASSHGEPSWRGSLSYVAANSSKNGSSSLPSNLCRLFSLAEIRSATNNFDSILIIGRGGFGDVYKGFINDGATPVAIKRLKPGSRQGAHEFKTEIEMLSQLRHVHLVSLIGYCNDDREMILVYDYMSRGTLSDHLYKTDNPPLSWKQRLQICIGAAKGLHYLHAGAKRMIIHRDVKTTNILLDDKWVAKVSDFGLSKINPNNMSNAHISTVVKGSIGYLDPEYYRRQQLTEKSDVYSFGVVLFEVLCGRPALDKMLDKDEVSLAAWARRCYQKGLLNQIVDPFLKGKMTPECLKKYGEIAMSCLHDEGIKRPSMNDVVWTLEFALELQESANEGIKPDVDHKEFEDEDALLFNDGIEMVENNSGLVSNSVLTTTSNEGTSFTSSSSKDRMSSKTVFSEIANPNAR